MILPYRAKWLTSGGFKGFDAICKRLTNPRGLMILGLTLKLSKLLAFTTQMYMLTLALVFSASSLKTNYKSSLKVVPLCISSPTPSFHEVGVGAGGNWQPSLHRLSTRLLICTALIIEWSLLPAICDGLLSLRPRSFLIRSIFSLIRP